MIEERLIVAWLAARSISRGLPAPVADHGGWRVDSGLPDELRRYVFIDPREGIRTLGEAIHEPFVALKLCAPAEALFALLPPRWRLTTDVNTKVMTRDTMPGADFSPPPGYRLDLATCGGVTRARIMAGHALAASGFAAEHDGVFVYDRIVTLEAHRRRGLGRALMAALASARRDAASREILTATPAGRALYLTMGWRDYSPYTTAMIPA